MRKIVRWTQVYETVVDLPKNCTMNNFMEHSDALDFDVGIKGAEGQADTFEILDIEDAPPAETDWSPDKMALATSDAYSAGSYTSWPAVCSVLKARGFDAREAEAILRSKWTRWARDAWNKPGTPTSKALSNFLTSGKVVPGSADVVSLVEGYSETDFAYKA